MVLFIPLLALGAILPFSSDSHFLEEIQGDPGPHPEPLPSCITLDFHSAPVMHF